MSKRKSTIKKVLAERRKLDRFYEADSVACWLHNNGGAITGNTEQSDAEWFARTLHQRTAHFGTFDAKPFFSHISNEDFKRLGLVPDRPWTKCRWETLSDAERATWVKLACACLAVLPELCERIGHRGMEQAKGIHRFAETLRK